MGQLYFYAKDVSGQRNFFIFVFQGCPEATAHGDIASYSGHLRRLLFCKIIEIFVHTK